MIDMCDGKLKLYSGVTETAVDWLWYPFIPYGKLTLLQGDPGCGKSTLMMNLIAAASSGNCSPDGKKLKKPLHVIYQCSEDGISDTIKPRLLNAGADCNNVAFLDEETDWITLNDEKIRRAIADFNAKLLVIDPVQAYLGETDIASAAAMRKVLRQLAAWAAMYDCAVVLIGHLNKKQSSKGLYRGLGSIDLVAAARSVLHIERLPEDEDIDSNTVNGLVQEKTCHLPKVGDRFTLGEYDGVVTRTAKRRVTEVRLTPAEKPEPKKEEDEKPHFNRLTNK